MFAHRRLRSRCCLPPYDFQTHRFTNPLTAGSLKAIAYLIDGSLAADGSVIAGSKTEVLKTFQMKRSHIDNDHCCIAQVPVTISSRGEWMMHMQATQHPRHITNAQQRPQFERFQRNRFRVDVRPTGLMTLNRTESLPALGKPEFPTILDSEGGNAACSAKRILARAESLFSCDRTARNSFFVSLM